MNPINRRSFLARSSQAATALALASRNTSLWSAPVPARCEASSTAGSALLHKYASAVQKMKALPASDPRNWTKQATIHNNFCPHNNWWFLPWHRAYLFFFEAVCKDVLADPSFRLPYWNWSKHNTIPAPFLSTSSPLFDSTRTATTIPPSIVSQNTVTQVVSSSALVQLFSGSTTTDTQRQSASTGLLEGGPHNGVHATILGDMGNFMSPLDPIFWLHHCNLDRIWASWSRITGHAQPTAPLWLNHTLTTFYDPVAKASANPKTNLMPTAPWLVPYDVYELPKGVRTLTPALREFGLSPSAPAPTPGAAGAHAISPRLTGQATPQAISVGSGANVAVSISGDLRSLAPPATQPRAAGGAPGGKQSQVYLVIEDVPMPSNPSTALRVFLNCESPSLKTPTTDPTYIGTISFFGGDHAAGGSHNTTFTLNISDNVAQAIASGKYTTNGALQVGIVPVDIAHPTRVSKEETIRPARIQILAQGS